MGGQVCERRDGGEAGRGQEEDEAGRAHPAPGAPFLRHDRSLERPSRSSHRSSGVLVNLDQGGLPPSGSVGRELVDLLHVVPVRELKRREHWRRIPPPRLLQAEHDFPVTQNEAENEIISDVSRESTEPGGGVV